MNDFWTKASPWARATFRCDGPRNCSRIVQRVRVKEGEAMVSYCYTCFLEAKRNASTELPGTGEPR